MVKAIVCISERVCFNKHLLVQLNDLRVHGALAAVGIKDDCVIPLGIQRHVFFDGDCFAIVIVRTGAVLLRVPTHKDSFHLCELVLRKGELLALFDRFGFHLAGTAVGMELYCGKRALPLGIQRDIVAYRASGNFGLVLISFAFAVRLRVPAGEYITFSSKLIIVQRIFFGLFNKLGCHGAGTAVGVEGYFEGSLLPLGVKRDILCHLAGGDGRLVRIACTGSVYLGIPTVKFVVRPRVYVFIQGKGNAEHALLRIHRADAAVGIEGNGNGFLPLGIEDKAVGDICPGDESPIGIRFAAAVGRRVPAGEYVFVTGEGIGVQAQVYADLALLRLHAALAAVGVKGHGNIAGFPLGIQGEGAGHVGGRDRCAVGVGFAGAVLQRIPACKIIIVSIELVDGILGKIKLLILDRLDGLHVAHAAVGVKGHLKAPLGVQHDPGRSHFFIFRENHRIAGLIAVTAAVTLGIPFNKDSVGLGGNTGLIQRFDRNGIAGIFHGLCIGFFSGAAVNIALVCNEDISLPLGVQNNGRRDICG